ncbi:endo-1,4-beta-xylanase [Catellatospora sp. KI3]|uniref:endo-1,4-beta-xylanase n=1 Tax=Catellatospora sp. KI3 TaxID=3041620 RepID=UPI002482355B|nr:endo-1,4-beta-xylanase [Catellatospora sp. KI3]MDI1461180.1 endo-1,4-beta-xylanase [Catellatospora sp. KI3]
MSPLSWKRLHAGLGMLLLAATLPVAVIALSPEPVRAADPVTVLTSDFEDGTTQSWAMRGTAEVVASSTAAAHAGTRSLLTSGRTAAWNGPSRSLLSTVTKGVRYTYSVWARTATGAGTAQLRMSVERRLGTTTNYEQVVNSTNVSESGWTQLTGSYTLANDADFFAVYVETVSGTASFHIDDFTLSYVPASPIQTGIPSLKTVFANDFPIGAAVGRSELLAEHGQLLAKHFNSLTPGNALKWDATEPTEGVFNYTDADAIVAFAKANGIKVRGHTFVWHQQTPAWVFNDAAGQPMTATAANKTLLLARLEAHIRAVGTRYANDIYAWDVVNEVIDENQSDGLRRSTWFNITGLDFIRTAFRVARQVAPNAKLYINDYNTNVAAKRDKLYALVSQLKAEGVPIDGVGHQMHGNVDWPTGADVDAMIAKFIPLGVEQQITEMDTSIYTSSSESFTTPPAERLTRQAARYKAWFDVYRKYKANITSVTLWGLADDNTWLDSYPVSRKDFPLLFDVSLQAKEAYWAIVGTTSPSASASASPSPSRSASPSPSASASPSASPSPSRSASPSPTASTQPVGCRVTYTITNQWNNGFQGDVVITNMGAAPVSGWTLRWTFANGQVINQAWNGNYTQTGASAAVTNASWNGTIAPGTSQGFGFLSSWSGTNSKPTLFSLNGTNCTVA